MLYWDNGKQNGNYYSIFGLYGDNGKENGNYYSILGLFGDHGKENGNYYNGLYISLLARPPLQLASHDFKNGAWDQLSQGARGLKISLASTGTMRSPSI